MLMDVCVCTCAQSLSRVQLIVTPSHMWCLCFHVRPLETLTQRSPISTSRTQNSPWKFCKQPDQCLLVPSRFSHGQLFVTPWTVTHQAPLSLEFSWQEYWSGLPFPSLGDPPNPEIEPTSLRSPALAGWFFTTSPPGKPLDQCLWDPVLQSDWGCSAKYPVTPTVRFLHHQHLGLSKPYLIHTHTHTHTNL